MNIYRVFPEPRQMLSLDDPDTAKTLASWYQPATQHSCRLSIIATPTGELTGADGTSRSLSNPADRRILVAQRQHANAVVTGAQTVRTEPVPVPVHAPLVVLSRTGMLADHQVTDSTLRDHSVIVLTGSDYSHDPTEFFPAGAARHIVLDEAPELSARGVVDYLRGEQFPHILVEGGRHIAQLFAAEHLFDELCVSLTAAPRAEHHPPVPWWESSWGSWTALHVLSDDLRTLYFRYGRESSAN